MNNTDSTQLLSAGEREIIEIQRLRQHLHGYPLDLRCLVGSVLDKREIELRFLIDQQKDT